MEEGKHECDRFAHSLTRASYVMGGTPDRRYNLSFIVQNSVNIGKPIIGVSIAYRLSAWGFLDSQGIRDEGNTNLGMKDQRYGHPRDRGYANTWQTGFAMASREHRSFRWRPK